MKDVEKTILRAFCLALFQQESVESLPSQTLTELRDIAQNLSTRVIELHTLAQSTPALAQPYKEARQWLNRQAAERGMGLDDFLPDPTDDQPDTEILNTARRVFQSTDERTIATALSSSDPVQAIKDQVDTKRTSTDEP